MANFLLSDSQLPPSGGLGNWLGDLKVGQKLTLGYAFVLGAAMLGTALGFIVADRYHEDALHEEIDAVEELYQVYRLQSSIFRVRTQQHKLIFYMGQPNLWQEKYPQLLEAVADVRHEWIDFKATFRNPQRQLKDTLPEKAAYDQLMLTKNDFDDYLNQSEVLFADSNPRNLSPTAISATQSRLFSFMHSPQVFTLDEFLDDIASLVDVTAAEYSQAKVELKRAEELRLQIITISLLISAAIATLLVLYMSRAIARPIQAVTYVAQQVTEKANFDLRAPVTSRDEIGILATSLNRLIQEVQQLLEVQKDSNEQLEVYSQILERKVQERTQELKEKNQSLQQTLEDLHQTQTKLIQTEKRPSPEPTVAEAISEFSLLFNSMGNHLSHVTDYSYMLLEMLRQYQQRYPETDRFIQDSVTQQDLESLKTELPHLLDAIQAEVAQMSRVLNAAIV
ncbi:MAG: HAMP domain-containing protein [Drouetiella hepatica Uher 2000/2452]|jgi:HAMP domain-containing protein|uniref:HAMP domain-containing protein n=1 Tax=Drouetiella hepatica Uher 2000/2452 TaxID=904376 RepID=A0A951QDE7_9CYAN|nr:HAMP domain-containing protein [Drouetiella hepatica Uher 2000/2452]